VVTHSVNGPTHARADERAYRWGTSAERWVSGALAACEFRAKGPLERSTSSRRTGKPAWSAFSSAC